MKSTSSEVKVWNTLIEAIIIPIHVSHFNTSTILKVYFFHLVALSPTQCMMPVWVFRGWRDGRMEEKSMHGLPAVIFFFSPTAGQRQPGQEAPSCPSTICRAPGAARIYPHRACEQPSLFPHTPSKQHPVAGGGSLSEGICVLERQGPESSPYCMCTLSL